MADYQNIDIAGKSKNDILAWIGEVKAWGGGYNNPIFVTAGTGEVIAENLRDFEKAVEKDLQKYMADKFSIVSKPPAKAAPKKKKK